MVWLGQGNYVDWDDNDRKMLEDGCKNSRMATLMAQNINIGGAKILASWHYKSYFITSFYKTSNINSFILAFNTIK